MKGGPDAIQGKADPRPAAFVPIRPQRHQQGFNFRSVDVGANRIGKYGMKRFLMFTAHESIVSENSIKSSINFIQCFRLSARLFLSTKALHEKNEDIVPGYNRFLQNRM
jgi:hypothetical protein